ncbi:2E4.130, partial [Symbiodinium sp. CCMP2456]
MATKWPNPSPQPKFYETVNIRELRYASDTISRKFQDGRSLHQLVEDLFEGIADPMTHPDLELDVVEYENMLYCLNNRRLWCLNHWAKSTGQHYSTKVKIRVYDWMDSPAFFQSRKTTPNCGQAVFFRQDDEDEDEMNTRLPRQMNMSKRKSEYIHVVCDGVHVDILTGARWILRESAMESAILDEEFSARQQWSAQFSVWHAKNQSADAAVLTAIKLAKLWVCKVGFPLWNALLRPRGFLIETIVQHVCRSSRTASCTGWDFFVQFLRFCSKEPAMDPIMWQWQRYFDHPDINWGSGPRVLDPLNPTNNLARQFRYWEDFRKQAKTSLERILERSLRSGSDMPSDPARDSSSAPAAGKEELRRSLTMLGVPVRSIEGLLDEKRHGFTSLELLCRYAKEKDLEDVGLNTVQRRRLMEAIQPGGCIFRKSYNQGSPDMDEVQPQEPRESARQREGRSTRWNRAGAGYEASVSEASHASHSSLISCPVRGGDRCFVVGTLVPTPDALLRVEDLHKRDVLIGKSGRLLTVQQVQRHPTAWHSLVTLRTEAASLTVTESHRVMVVTAEGYETDRKASQLIAGDRVSCAQGPSILRSVARSCEQMEIVEVVVRPDEPFESYPPPSDSIFSKGRAPE